ncbi:MAG: hypothetical protein ACSHWZ_05770 [Sulfitobacter sp.]
MFEVIFALIAVALNGGGGQIPAQVAAVPAQVASPTVQIGAGVVIGSAVQSGGLDMSAAPAGLVAEPQQPTGKFTTAAEVKPIMGATKGNWVAVREYDGADLVYVTHIWSWRCGMAAMAVSVNDGPLQDWPLPECHLEYATPAAILDEDGLPFRSYPLGSVQKLTVQIIYDDLSGEVATFERGNVLIP